MAKIEFNREEVEKIDLAIKDTLSEYRKDIDDDKDFGRWLYNQAYLPYEKHPYIGLDQRLRMKNRIKRLTGIQSLTEDEFAERLKKFADEFFEKEKELKNDARVYYDYKI